MEASVFIPLSFLMERGGVLAEKRRLEIMGPTIYALG